MIVSFGYLTKKSLLFLVVPVLMFIRIFLADHPTNEPKSMFCSSFFQFLARSFHGIVWLIFTKLYQPNKSEEEDNTLKVQTQKIELQLNGSISYENESIIPKAVSRIYESTNHKK